MFLNLAIFSLMVIILFFLFLTLMLVWKNFEFLSPYFSQISLSFCLKIDSILALWVFNSSFSFCWSTSAKFVDWRWSNSLSNFLIFSWATLKWTLFHVRKAFVVLNKLLLSWCLPFRPSSYYPKHLSPHRTRGVWCLGLEKSEMSLRTRLKSFSTYKNQTVVGAL